MKIDLWKIESGKVVSSNKPSYFFKNYQTYQQIPKRFKLKPSIKIGGITRFLNIEIHDWLMQYDVEYSLYFEEYIIDDITWGIDISDEGIAMLFKLTWL